MGTMETAPNASLERLSSPPGTEVFDLIVSPSSTSLARDLVNGAKVDRLIREMNARGYRSDRRKREDGAVLVRFTKP